MWVSGICLSADSFKCLHTARLLLDQAIVLPAVTTLHAVILLILPSMINKVLVDLLKPYPDVQLVLPLLPLLTECQHSQPGVLRTSGGGAGEDHDHPRQPIRHRVHHLWRLPDGLHGEIQAMPCSGCAISRATEDRIPAVPLQCASWEGGRALGSVSRAKT